jgi:G3E family GTPase
LLILLAVPASMTPRQKRPPAPFPLTIVTGFLGAGKTSLLNALLRDPALAGTLVIVNEFGEIGLDHLLVERLDGDMLLMTSGCLCCSIRGDLIATLEDILRRRDNGRIAPFQRVMIETTGLADPAPVLHTVMAHPYFMLRFRVDGVITLVDTVNGNATLDAHEEAVKQAAMADRLVLSKTDLLTAGSTGSSCAPEKTQSGRGFARRRERRSLGLGASRCRDLRSGSKNSRCAALVERGSFCSAGSA